MTEINSKKLLLLPEVAERLRMPMNTIRYKRLHGELPFLFKLGGKIVALEADVDAYIDEQRNQQLKENAS